MPLKDSVAIVTGSATGVGASVATQLAQKGCRVVVNYSKSETEAKATLAACLDAGTDAILVQGDVAKDADCRGLAAAALERWGRIDVLVNNAGISQFADHARLELLEPDDFHRIYGVNVVAPYLMVRAVAPTMQQQGSGSVVNVSSIAGVMGIGSSIAYAASKGALNTMTLSLARALGPSIRVNAVCPGMIESRWLREGLGENMYLAVKKRFEESTPLRKVAQPDHIARVVISLVWDCELVTGETIMIDGGLHLDYARAR
jgi:3-oxoacyl-[acyl-carrier protein] reductase